MMKKNLLLLHGALGASSQLEPLKALLEKEFEVYTMNFRGHGGTEIPDEDFSFTLFTSSILEFMGMHALLSVNIFGGIL